MPNFLSTTSGTQYAESDQPPVVCPWHSTEFNVKTGETLGPLTDEGVRSLPVKVQGSDVLVELE